MFDIFSNIFIKQECRCVSLFAREFSYIFVNVQFALPTLNTHKYYSINNLLRDTPFNNITELFPNRNVSNCLCLSNLITLSVATLLIFLSFQDQQQVLMFDVYKTSKHLIEGNQRNTYLETEHIQVSDMVQYSTKVMVTNKHFFYVPIFFSLHFTATKWHFMIDTRKQYNKSLNWQIK